MVRGRAPEKLWPLPCTAVCCTQSVLPPCTQSVIRLPPPHRRCHTSLPPPTPISYHPMVPSGVAPLTALPPSHPLLRAERHVRQHRERDKGPDVGRRWPRTLQSRLDRRACAQLGSPTNSAADSSTRRKRRTYFPRTLPTRVLHSTRAIINRVPYDAKDKSTTDHRASHPLGNGFNGTYPGQERSGRRTQRPKAILQN
jgi:hypothetical protein